MERTECESESDESDLNDMELVDSCSDDDDECRLCFLLGDVDREVAGERLFALGFCDT